MVCMCFRCNLNGRNIRLERIFSPPSVSKQTANALLDMFKQTCDLCITADTPVWLWNKPDGEILLHFCCLSPLSATHNHHIGCPYTRWPCSNSIYTITVSTSGKARRGVLHEATFVNPIFSLAVLKTSNTFNENGTCFMLKQDCC